MRGANRTVALQHYIPQSHTQYHQYTPEVTHNYNLSRSRAHTQHQWQKTEQPKLRQVSPNALKIFNEQMERIMQMDGNKLENSLRITAKQVYELVDNQLLFGMKHLTSMKLLLYHVILLYVDEFTQHERLKKQQEIHRQKSINSSKNITSLKQHDITLNNYSPNIPTYLNNSRDLNNLKQTIPFVPKDKSMRQKNARIQMLQEELSSKIQATKQSLQNILRKIQIQANYRLSGEDIMRLKKSVINVSELKPSLFFNLHTLTPSQPPKPINSTEFSRPESRQAKHPTDTSSMSRNNSRSKTTNTGVLKDTFGSTIQNSRMQDVTSDDEGNKLLIEQLEQIIERKENRIKQLTKQLTKNLFDQKELEKTIENFEIEIGQIQRDRKNFQQIIEKLQEENLHYQLEIKEYQDAQILRQEAARLSSSHQQDSSHYHMLKEFQTRQKVMKFTISKQLQMLIEGFSSLQNSSRQKDINSMSRGSPFNDISQITPKRQSKQPFLPTDIDESYILQNNGITTRKHISPQITSNQKSNNRSVSKYQMLGGNSRTLSKSKKQIQLYSNSREEEMKDGERETFQKMIFLQALTIQQMLQDM